MKSVSIIGSGLAGSQAALSLAELGFEVELYEMKPEKKSPAHHLSTVAELVCSNSLKSMRLDRAAGLLKGEGLMLGASLLRVAAAHAVPAGGALAVDRESFSEAVTEALDRHPKIHQRRGEVTRIPDARPLVIATGPLTTEPLLQDLLETIGDRSLSFFDAAAPIIDIEKLDPDLSFRQSRYDRGGDDYINCPLNKKEYEAFYEALVTAECAELKDFDKKFLFQGCQPVEQIALTGKDSLRFGPMKPVGLEDPRTGRRPYANLQLRQENYRANLYNLVGFQTQLKFLDQRRVFRMIPALKEVDFVRYGVMHRNAFVDAPRHLGTDFQLRDPKHRGIYVIGQLSGLEGYVPAIVSGQTVALQIALEAAGEDPLVFPQTSIWGALLGYMTCPTMDYQPMAANFGLLPDLSEHIRNKNERYAAYARRALESLDACLEPWRSKLAILRPLDEAYIIEQMLQ